MSGKAKTLRSPRREPELIRCPSLPGGRVSTHGLRSKAVKERIIRRMNREKLSLEVGREIRDLEAGVFENPLDLVAVSLALGR